MLGRFGGCVLAGWAWIAGCSGPAGPEATETADTAALVPDTDPLATDTSRGADDSGVSAGGDDSGAPSETAPPTPTTLVTTAEATAALSAAVPGLWFFSESESAVDVLVLTSPQALPTLSTLPDLVAPVWTSTQPPALPERDVEVRSLAALFDPLTVEQPWWDDVYRAQSAPWGAIRSTLESLDGARVWRLGRGIGGGVVGGSVEVYVLGGTAEGDLVGVHFVAVET